MCVHKGFKSLRVPYGLYIGGAKGLEFGVYVSMHPYSIYKSSLYMFTLRLRPKYILDGYMNPWHKPTEKGDA